ncbi:hypothetical protein LGV61_01030 [Desulfurispirillum indicum]|uniref:hypothetical protein n=1 Tax=Desulfurispirillum indicum TaxID=936456 RepID=UPI001CFBBA97|nr:hypothetical protein [Desulfurispirillum indicum]UCZ56885.1 hypothetical protein LGV61_01030 [Desulfurispirillum indicum]
MKQLFLALNLTVIAMIFGCNSDDKKLTSGSDGNTEILLLSDKKKLIADNIDTASISISAVQLPARTPYTSERAYFRSTHGAFYTSDNNELGNEGLYLDVPGTSMIFFRSYAVGTAEISVSVRGATATLEIEVINSVDTAPVLVEVQAGPVHAYGSSGSPLPLRYGYHSQEGSLRFFRPDRKLSPDNQEFNLFVTDTVIRSAFGDASARELVDNGAAFLSLPGGHSIMAGDVILLNDPDISPTDRLRIISTEPAENNRLRISYPYSQSYTGAAYTILGNRLETSIFGQDSDGNTLKGRSAMLTDGAADFVVQYDFLNYPNYGCLPADPTRRLFIMAIGRDAFHSGFISAEGQFCFQ